jgi:hypothetical protein
MLYANRNKIEKLCLVNKFYQKYSFVKQDRSIKDIFTNYERMFLIQGDVGNADTGINLLVDPAIGKIIEQKDLTGFNMLEIEWYSDLILVTN